MDDLREKIMEIRESQIRTEADLKYHIKRTDLLEEEVNKIEKDVRKITSPMPLKEKVQIAAIISALVGTVSQLLKHFGM
jgi:hypothetical protein